MTTTRACAVPECTKQPNYAAESGEPAYCLSHKELADVDVRIRRCEAHGCDGRPNYGYNGEAPRLCVTHKLEGMHNLRSRKCKVDGCDKYASCGLAKGVPETCGNHKEEGMINLIGRRCFNIDCETYASYGLPGTRERFCAKHKDENMVNLTVKQCEHRDCTVQPSYNYEGQRKARFCMEHRQSAMIDVLDRHCRERGCDRQPIYGNPHQMTGKPSWCPSHRPQNSFDVKTSRCQDPSCSKHPSYGYDKDRVRRRCRLHKLPDMVDVKSPRCEAIDCRKQPCCGHLGAKARFCSEHKEDGMVNLKTRAYRCKHKGSEKPLENHLPNGRSTVCNRTCRFAFPGKPAMYCAIHHEEGMVDVLNPRCRMGNCLEIPTHGHDGQQPMFCIMHMAPGMKAVVAQNPNILHWSTEARKQAETTARESNRMTYEREAGSVKCTPLPPKTDLARKRTMEADANARAAAAARPMEGLSACAPVTTLPQEDMTSNITNAELTLAFGDGTNPMSAATVTSVSSGAVPASATAGYAITNRVTEMGASLNMADGGTALGGGGVGGAMYGIGGAGGSAVTTPEVGGAAGFYTAGTPRAFGYAPPHPPQRHPPPISSMSNALPNTYAQQLKHDYQAALPAVVTVAHAPALLPPPPPVQAHVPQVARAPGPGARLPSSVASLPLPALSGIDSYRAPPDPGAPSKKRRSSEQELQDPPPSFYPHTATAIAYVGFSAPMSAAPAPAGVSGAIATAVLPATTMGTSITPIGVQGTVPGTFPSQQMVRMPFMSAPMTTASAMPATSASGEREGIPVVPQSAVSRAPGTSIPIVEPNENHVVHSQPLEVPDRTSPAVPVMVSAPPTDFDSANCWEFPVAPGSSWGLPARVALHMVAGAAAAGVAACTVAGTWTPEALATAEGTGRTTDVCGATRTSPGCAEVATFGHPDSGRGPTHCLTHYEEGVDRFADDTFASNAKGMKRKTPPFAPASTTPAEQDSITEPPPSSGKGRRTKKATANASQGMLLLAGAVVARGDDDDDEIDEP